MTSVTDPGTPGDADAVPLEAPAPPDVSGLVNLRDVGGLPTDDGRRTRAGVLYRSEMPRIGDAAPSDLTWPPRTVIDLRSAIERGTDPHPLVALGATVVVIPLFGDRPTADHSAATASAIERGLGALYQVMVTYAAPQIAQIVNLVAEAPGPVLIHCAAGKDRTGVTVAVLLRLAGVIERDILDDYAATGPNMPGVLRRLRGHAILPGTGSAQAGGELTRISPQAAEAVLAATGGHPGGVAGWLLEHGASAESIRLWRERVLA
ncbi:tyrosine-protein phosphatase [Frankia sp. AgKG'84/4]|uniref:tyrosine-protein phosphatase n=1 Tax=Frankia sp. AgKG'84/4 TaxID=573490 RepID=UPI00200BE0EC|nr:tyrosine-protein phosphatase [Frankia sp. AgKG'84/4]MCL9793114.1 tyrosine-protein phosphatase [Frankia sp. AgKG'84/4]